MYLIRKLIFAENIMCIYRNFWSFNKIQKKLIVMRIIVELCITVAIFGSNLTLVTDLKLAAGTALFSKTIAQVIVLSKCFVVVIGGIRYSESFAIFYKNVQNLHKSYGNKSFYLKFEKRLKRKCLVSSVMFAVILVPLSVLRVMKWSYLVNDLLFKIIALIANEMWMDFRYILEHLVIYTAIADISSYLKYLSDSVLEVLKKYSEEGSSDMTEEVDEEYFDITEKVKSWAEMYRNIIVCSKNMSLCFNELLLFSVGVTILEYVSSMYNLTSIIMKKIQHRYFDPKTFVYILLYHMMITTPLFIAGQKLQNECSILNKSLARLSSEVSTYRQRPEIRQIKDLNRLVSINPIVIKFGTFTLGMYLCPMILSLSATYIVILLQFNHII